MKYSRIALHPLLPTSKPGDTFTGYLVWSWRLHQIEVDRETDEVRFLADWNPYGAPEVEPGPAEAIAWCRDWWSRVRAAPTRTEDESQWNSHHATLLDGRVYLWSSDRHEQFDTLDEVVRAEDFRAGGDERQRRWLDAALRAPNPS